MADLHPAARELLESDALVHLVTLNPDGSPQLSCVWVGMDGDEIVIGKLMRDQKIANIGRDPRVALSIEAEGDQFGMQHYLVVEGTARITEGGAPELLQRLAHVYLGPDVRFPPMDDPPSGVRLRISVERVGGVGPWAG